MIMMGKKRYCAVQVNDKYKLTGISAVRQDSYGILRECSRGMAELLLTCEMSLHNLVLAEYMSRVLEAPSKHNITMYEGSKLVKKNGMKGFCYVAEDMSEIRLDVNDADLTL